MSDQTHGGEMKALHKKTLARGLINWLWPMLRDFPRELLRVKLIRFMVGAIRYAWFVFILRRMRTLQGAAGVARSTIMHNMRGMFDLHVERSIRLIYPVVAYAAGTRADVGRWKVLTIGPRTEGELFNLVAHGFHQDNITGLDLITYSPMIELGDMHAMRFADDSFDLAIVGWVISYSDDKQRAAAEIVRVVKPGGLVALGVEWNEKSPDEIAAETGYVIGSADRLPTVQAIIDLFDEAVDRVYFQTDDQDVSTAGHGDLLVVFRVAGRQKD